MRDSFRRIKRRAVSFDIVTGGAQEDLSTREGFESLMLTGLRLIVASLIFAGPPCSLFIFLSSSQHQRHVYGAEGSPWDRLTRLSNLLVRNMVSLLI